MLFSPSLKSPFCLIKPLVATFPANVSPLYAFFVPHGTRNDLDFALSAHVMTLNTDAPNYMGYGDNLLEPGSAELENTGRMIDMLMLARTCRHATAHIEVAEIQRRLKNVAERAVSHTVCCVSVSGCGYHFKACDICYYTKRPDNAFVEPVLDMQIRRGAAAVLAALAGRMGVAKALCPAVLRINTEAFRLLFLRSPKCTQFTIATFVKEPLFRGSATASRGDITRVAASKQYYWWLRLTLQFNVPYMGPLCLKAATSKSGMDALVYDVRFHRLTDYHHRLRPYLEKLHELIVASPPLDRETRRTTILKMLAEIKNKS